MYKVKKGFENHTISVAGKEPFCGAFKDATQEQLENMYHLGVELIELVKGAKNKKIDNLENEPLPIHKDDAE